MKQAKNTLLLLEDVHGLGRSGELVTAKPGYIRNYLIPQKKAVIAGEHTIRLQAKLKEERAKQAVVDKKEAEELAKKFVGLAIHTKVKVDKEGHMYGSVSATDVARLIEEQCQIKLEKRQVGIHQGIKSIGVHEVPLKLKEGVVANIKLQIEAEKEEEKAE